MERKYQGDSKMKAKLTEKNQTRTLNVGTEK
jgi:hypothetical protein